MRESRRPSIAARRLLLAGACTASAILAAPSGSAPAGAAQVPAAPAPPASAAPAPPAPTPRPTPPTRDPHAAGFVAAVELADGNVPPPDADGNFILGPTHAPAPETQAQDDIPKGTVHE
ncbi:MAG: hypothetical protein ACHP85_12645, partial [Burkholderiales bacterium]